MGSLTQCAASFCLFTAAVLAGAPAALQGSDASRPEDGAVAFNVRIRQEATADWVRRALAGAYKRLSEPSCQGIFEAFSDPTGHPLRENLEALQKTGQSYLGWLIFYDGTKHPGCAARGILAVTERGSRVVYVCPEAFRSAAMHDPLLVEAVLIHEELHSLGLGEDQPSSQEVTSRVIKNCH